MDLTIHCQYTAYPQVLILRKRNLDQEALNIFKQWFHPVMGAWSVAFLLSSDKGAVLRKQCAPSLKMLEKYWYIFTPWFYVIYLTSYCTSLNIMVFCGQYDPVSGLYFVSIIDMDNTYIHAYACLHSFTLMLVVITIKIILKSRPTYWVFIIY